MTDKTFTQADYNALTGALDEAIERMKGFGKSETEARKWLHEFMVNHYFPVWREIQAPHLR